jgi:hypothetical protein
LILRVKSIIINTSIIIIIIIGIIIIIIIIIINLGLASLSRPKNLEARKVHLTHSFKNTLKKI